MGAHGQGSQKFWQNTNQLQTESSFFRKMKHEVTLRSEILSQLDFKSAPRDVVFTCLDGQVEANALFLAIISPFLQQLLLDQERQSHSSAVTCSSCISKTYISVPGLPSKEVSAFLSSLVEGGKDVFYSQGLRRLFFPLRGGEEKLEVKRNRGRRS